MNDAPKKFGSGIWWTATGCGRDGVTDFAGLLFAAVPGLGFALPFFELPFVNVAELVGLPPDDVGVTGVASGENTETRESLSTEAEAEPSLSRIKSETTDESLNFEGFFVSGGGITSVLCFKGEPKHLL